MAPSEIRLKLPFHLIQSIRFAHALMESDFVISIPYGEIEKFAYAKRFFKNLRFTTYFEEQEASHEISLCHQTPFIKVGDLTKPMLFPREIFEMLRGMWPQTRKWKYSFCGLVTPQRREVLSRWAKEFEVLPKRGILTKLRKILFPGQPTVMHGAREILFWESKRGRLFPTKIWDLEYYKKMTQSQFVLCPNGDSVWTYRFFEACMCGAIPIIEDDCLLYHGFKYYQLKDEAPVQWSEKDAEHNFQMAKTLLTLEKVELDSALFNVLDEVRLSYAI